MKKLIKSYLLFTKKERIGLMVVLFLLGFFMVLPGLIKSRLLSPTHADTAWLEPHEKSNVPKNDGGNNTYKAAEITKPSLFYFDPNTATENEFQQLGLSFKNSQTILRYRQKGGHFKTAQDFLKIWGIDPSVAAALIPFIRIKSEMAVQEEAFSNKSRSYNPPYSPKKIPIIDVNTASLNDWEALPGIGPVLAARIIKFRDKLGGFTEIIEIKKTYGISDSLFNIIQPFLMLPVIGKPSINTSSEARLIKAGVSPEIAAAIVQYRSQYGLFQQLEDLKKIVFLQTDQYLVLINLVKL